LLETQWSSFDDIPDACVGRSASVVMVDVCTEHSMKVSSDGDKLTRNEFRSSSADSGYVCCAHDVSHSTRETKYLHQTCSET